MNLLYYLIIAILCVGCVKNPVRAVNDICDSDSVVLTKKTPTIKNRLYSSSVNGKTAIGNIKFGITQSAFKKERKIFIKNFPTIADLEVSDVIPIFDSGILIGIIIHSKGTKSIKPNCRPYLGGDDYERNYERSGLVKLYDKKYAKHRLDKGVYLKDGISYEIILDTYITPENKYKDRTNQREWRDSFSDLYDFESLDSRYYTSYNYLIISNQLYLDSLESNHNKEIKERQSKKEKRDYDAI